jgi:hypothetical protein
MKNPTQEALDEIIEGFRRKASQAAIKKGSKAYRTMHFDYFYGSMMTLQALGFNSPPIWTLNLMSSRDISDDGRPI